MKGSMDEVGRGLYLDWRPEDLSTGALIRPMWRTMDYEGVCGLHLGCGSIGGSIVQPSLTPARPAMRNRNRECPRGPYLGEGCLRQDYGAYWKVFTDTTTVFVEDHGPWRSSSSSLMLRSLRVGLEGRGVLLVHDHGCHHYPSSRP